jgi:hypothetical protein
MLFVLNANVESGNMVVEFSDVPSVVISCVKTISLNIKQVVSALSQSLSNVHHVTELASTHV